MTLLRTVLAAVMIAFAITIVWAVMNGDFWGEGSWMLSHPWGIIALADLYIGFLLSSIVIAALEKPRNAMLWILPMPFLGNVWTLVWFLVRLPILWRKLRGA